MTEARNQPVAYLKAAEHRNQAVANVISTGNPPGLLDLPPELRLMVFRHLLVYPHNLDLEDRNVSRPPIAILRASRLINKEAFDVLYRGNRFIFKSYGHPSHWPRSFQSFPRFIDMMQNIHVEIPLYSKLAIPWFLIYMRRFGNPSSTRGTFAVDFCNLSVVEDRTPMMEWFIGALGRFTNFKTIELRFSKTIAYRVQITNVTEYFESALEPVLGHAEYFGHKGRGLRFHPMDHPNHRRKLEDTDWADYLDGIRLEWNA